MTVTSRSRWTAPSYSTDVYYLILHHAEVILCASEGSQLFLVNPDQLACQERITDTVDLQAISRPAVCNSRGFSPATSSPVCFLPPSLVSSAIRTPFLYVISLLGLTPIPPDSCLRLSYSPLLFSVYRLWFHLWSLMSVWSYVSIKMQLISHLQKRWASVLHCSDLTIQL